MRTPAGVLVLRFPVRLLVSTNVYILLYKLMVWGFVARTDWVQRCDLHASNSSSLEFSTKVDHAADFDYNIADGDDLSSVL